MKYLLQIPILIGLIFTFSSWAIAERTVTDNYKVGVNDILGIKVLEHAELDTVATVAFDGTIDFPYINTLNVRGMTLLQIKDEITKRLSEGYLKYPIVSVSLARSGSTYMYVYGEVQGRGQIVYENDMTIIKGLSSAQGITLNGLYGKLIVRRKQKGTGIYKNIVEVNINNGFIANKEVEDMPLQPGDVLIIESNKTFLTQGEVMNRGRFALEKNMTVERALLQAGGITPDGRYGKVIVKRKKENTVGPYIVFAESYIDNGFIKKREVSDILIEPDDILIVERFKTFSIQGEVFSRGRIMLEDGMTVINALAIAGGASNNGMYGKIKLKRRVEEESGVYYKDIAESDLVNGYIDSKQVQNFPVQPDDILFVERNKQFYVHGEVGVPGPVTLEKGMTVLRALSVARGISSSGLYGKVRVRRMNSESGEYENIEINLKGIIEGNETKDMLLQAEDILIVERNKMYFIYGEFNRTGEFVLEEDLTAFKAAVIGGGLTKWGAESRVQILRPNNNGIGYHIINVNINNIIKGDTSADVKLEAGDTIVALKGIF